MHGIGGSGGVGVLLLAAIHSHMVALVALFLFAGCTAISMALLSTGFGYVLGRPQMQRAFARVVPAFGAFSLCFGLLVRARRAQCRAVRVLSLQAPTSAAKAIGLAADVATGRTPHR